MKKNPTNEIKKEEKDINILEEYVAQTESDDDIHFDHYDWTYNDSSCCCQLIMFGYFRPYHANLTNSEKRLFDSYYCRICYCLRILGGQLARFFTTYDGAIYSMIVDLQTKNTPPPHLPCERVGKRNLKYFQADEDGEIELPVDV